LAIRRIPGNLLTLRRRVYFDSSNRVTQMQLNQTFEIRFEGLSTAQAGINVDGLCDELVRISPDIHASRKKDDQTTQDFGATLLLILGTPAVVAVATYGVAPAIKSLAEGIASYLKRNHAKITISADGEVIADGVSGNDAARIAEAFAKKAQQKKEDAPKEKTPKKRAAKKNTPKRGRK